MPIRILLADDHGVLRAGLRALLDSEEDLEIIGEAGNGDEAIEMTQELEPDLLLLDISMPGPGGIEVTNRLKRIKPEVKILILTVHEDEGLLQAAIQNGASGYITKRAAESELISAVRAVYQGEIYVHPSMTRALLRAMRPTTLGGTRPVEPLTPREIEVLKYIAQGCTNRQIGEMLSISVRTVESHRSNLMGKLQLRSRVDLVRYARENGLLE